jgi:YhcH/YjgK/YiaL family protein
LTAGAAPIKKEHFFIMIVGRLKDWNKRLRGAPWETAFRALERLGPDAPEGETRLDGDDVFMRVLSYPTRSPEDPGAGLEAHREFIDIQMALVGGERIDWFPVEELVPKAPYDPACDVQFFLRPGSAPASVDVLPGTFAVFFPEDAHMPQLVTARGDDRVKKAVVKIRLARLG